MTNLVVTINDAAALKYCRKGCRAFCDRHGFNWADVIGGGIPASELLEIDDEMARDLVRQAEKRVKEENEQRK